MVSRFSRAALSMAVALMVGSCALACGSSTEVSYESADEHGNPLVIYVGSPDDRDIISYAADHLAAARVAVTLVDATDDSNAKVAAGDGDLAFFQHIPAFEADSASHPGRDLSIVSKVSVVPYGLYSSTWRNLDDTPSWVNTGIVSDHVVGQSLPHGSRVALPSTPTGFARGLYLLQSVGLVTLDRPFGGTTAADLTIGTANVRDSARHLSLLDVSIDDYVKAVYENYDAVVLTPKQAASIGLTPARDALAIEPGRANPYAHVLVAPARLAGDRRVVELVHALESPGLNQYLSDRFHGSNIAVAAARN